MFRKLLVAVIFFIVATNLLMAQEKPILPDTTNNRIINYTTPEYYTSFTVGLFEAFSFSVAKKLSPRLTATVKLGLIVMEANSPNNDYDGETGFDPLSSLGLGLRLHFNKWFIFRYSGLEYLRVYGPTIEDGYAIQWVAGDATEFDSGFAVLYEVGAMYSSGVLAYKNPGKTVTGEFGGVLKIGCRYNFNF